MGRRHDRPRRGKIAARPQSCRPFNGATSRARGTSGEACRGAGHDERVGSRSSSRVGLRSSRGRQDGVAVAPRRTSAPLRSPRGGSVDGAAPRPPGTSGEAHRGGGHGGRAASHPICRVDLCRSRRQRDGVAVVPRRANVLSGSIRGAPVDSAVSWARGTSVEALSSDAGTTEGLCRGARKPLPLVPQRRHRQRRRVTRPRGELNTHSYTSRGLSASIAQTKGNSL